MHVPYIGGLPTGLGVFAGTPGAAPGAEAEVEAVIADLFARAGGPSAAASVFAGPAALAGVTASPAELAQLAQDFRQRLVQLHAAGVLGGGAIARRAATAPSAAAMAASTIAPTMASALASALLRQTASAPAADALPVPADALPVPADAPPPPTAPAPAASPLQSAITRNASTWLRRPMRGPLVAELQRQLRAAGFDPGPIDGYLGPVTERALLAFQRAAGITVDGKAGPQTVGALLARTNTGAASTGAANTGAADTGAANTGAAAPAPGATPVGGPEAPVSPTIDGMLSWARSKIGTPYAAVNPFRFGNVPWDGQPHKSVNGSDTVWNYPKGTQVFDCSGFVVAAYREIGVDLAKFGATTSSTIASSPHLANVSREDLRPGDLITYRSKNGIGHVVIYLGNGQTIEATGSKGVTIGTVDWERASAFKRVPLPGA